MEPGLIAAAVFTFGTGIWFVGDTEMKNSVRFLVAMFWFLVSACCVGVGL